VEKRSRMVGLGTSQALPEWGGRLKFCQRFERIGFKKFEQVSIITIKDI